MISVHSSGQPSTKMIACDSSMNWTFDRSIDSTQLLDQFLSAEDREHCREQRRADEQPAHHRSGLGREEHRFLDALGCQRAIRVEGHQEERRPRPPPGTRVAVVMPNRITPSTTSVRMPSGAMPTTPVQRRRRISLLGVHLAVVPEQQAGDEEARQQKAAVELAGSTALDECCSTAAAPMRYREADPRARPASAARRRGGSRTAPLPGGSCTAPSAPGGSRTPALPGGSRNAAGGGRFLNADEEAPAARARLRHCCRVVDAALCSMSAAGGSATLPPAL